MVTAAQYARRKAAKAARAAAKPAAATAVLEPDDLMTDAEMLEGMPDLGDLLPSPEDYVQVMQGVDQPSGGLVEDAAMFLGMVNDAPSGDGAGGSLGPLSAWTTPEAQKKGKNFVQHSHEWGGRWMDVYDRLGNTHRMLKEDVPAALLVPDDTEHARRRFLRCPRCVRLPNRGIHKVSGPNGCPAREPRLKTYCDVCWAHGNRVPIYEDHDPSTPAGPAPFDAADPLFRAPHTPVAKSREEGLQMKLDDHIRAVHITTARRRGLRRD